MIRVNPCKSVAELLAVVLLFGALAHADTLTGKVTNATQGKPAAGDDVVLLNLSQGMSEADRTKTDAQGQFKFDIKDPGVPHLVRVNHQGVNYFPEGGPIRPGMTTVEIKVYDAAKKLDGVSTTVQVMRLQSDGSTLQVLSLYAVNNASKPPRALMNDRPYEITLPEGAQIDQSVAQSAGGMPINNAPVPAEKGKFYFVFPLRPGETRFEVAYHIPYTGEADIHPSVEGNLQHFAVLLPKSMQFTQKVEGTYSPMNDDKGQTNIQVATGVTPQKDVSFRVSGTGMLPDEDTAANGGGGEQPSSAGAEQDTQAGRPGGGLGTPEGTPDPLHKYRFGILAGCGALLAMGAFWVVSRNNGQPALAASAGGSESIPIQAAPLPANAAAQVSRSALLLEALKEELFQLEVERQQGRITPEDYAKAKAALDETLRRAVSRTTA